MTPEIIASLIAGVFGLLTLIVNGVIAVRLRDHSAKIEEIKKATDGLTSALVKEGKAASRAEGLAEGMVEGEAAAHLRALEKSVNGRRAEIAAAPAPVDVKIIADANSPVPVKTIRKD